MDYCRTHHNTRYCPGTLGATVKVPWRMTFSTYEQYLECVEKLSILDPDYDFEEYGELCEELTNLDGYPTNARIDEDIIVPVLPESVGPLVVLNVHE